MAKTQTLSPSQVDPSKVTSAVARLKSYISMAKDYDNLAENFKEKSGVDLRNVKDPRDFVSQKMISDAKSRTKRGKEGAIPVIGNPSAKSTCLAGVCTIAAEAGVSFDKMSGNLITGIGVDKKGRKIPQYNRLFTSQFDKTGYYELSPDEKPMPGDLVQYFEPKGSLNELVPYHMEFITDEKGGGKYATFNNYGLFNEGKGESEVIDARGSDKGDRGRDSSVNRFYRLKPEAASAAVGKDNMTTIARAKELSNQLDSIFQKGIPGESSDFFDFVSSAILTNQPKEKVLKIALDYSKDKELAKALVEKMYQ